MLFLIQVWVKVVDDEEEETMTKRVGNGEVGMSAEKPSISACPARQHR